MVVAGWACLGWTYTRIRTHTLHLIRFVSFFFLLTMDTSGIITGLLILYFLMHAQFLIFFSFFPPETCVSSNDFLFFVLRI